MDILNWINWKKAGRIVSTITNKGLIAVGEPDPKRDDKYLTVAITKEDFAASLTPGVVTDDETLRGNGTLLNPLAVGKVDINGNTVISNNTAFTVSVANGASHSIPNFSGMLIVNDHYDGRVETWIAGGGDAILLGATSAAGPCNNTVTINSENGYDWTNVDNLTGPFTFTVIKTRLGS